MHAVVISKAGVWGAPPKTPETIGFTSQARLCNGVLVSLPRPLRNRLSKYVSYLLLIAFVNTCFHTYFIPPVSYHRFIPLFHTSVSRDLVSYPVLTHTHISIYSHAPLVTRARTFSFIHTYSIPHTSIPHTSIPPSPGTPAALAKSLFWRLAEPFSGAV